MTINFPKLTKQEVQKGLNKVESYSLPVEKKGDIDWATSTKQYYEQLQPKYITWDFYQRYTTLEPPFGQLGLPVFLRTYSRFIPFLKRREKWCETVLRNVEFNINLDKHSSFDELKKEAEELFDYMFNLKTFPSGRSLWTAGTSQTQADPSSTWNCTFRTIDSISSYGEIFYWLLIGAGCGFSVEKEYTDQLPNFYNKKPSNKWLKRLGEYLPLFSVLTKTKNVKHINTKQDHWFSGEDDTTIIINDKYVKDLKYKHYLVGSDDVYYSLLDIDKTINTVEIVVGDSKEGWVVALRFYLTLLTLKQGFNITFNYKRVRPAGVPLKRFGGVATGCKNFVRMIDQIDFIFSNVNGQLNTNQAMDLVGIVALCVVSGNIRRSALIGLGEPTDELFKGAKYKLWENDEKEPYRAFRVMSNNSIVVDEKLNKDELFDVFEKIKSNGEPGLSVRGNARKYDPFITGFNPCFAAGTMVMTRNGHYPIENLVGKTVDVWDGNQWVTVDNFRVTGENQEVWEVELHSGQKIKATPYHTFILSNGQRVELKDLRVGQTLKSVNIVNHGETHVEGAYLKGFMLGDGSVEKNRAYLAVYQPKEVCMARLESSLSELPVGKVSTTAIVDINWINNESNRQSRKLLTGITVRDNEREVYKYVTKYRNGLPEDILNWDYVSKCEFIAGLFDADACALDTYKGFSYQIQSVSLDVLEDLQRLLKTIGVSSKIKLSRKNGFSDFGEERGGICKVKTAYRLTIPQSHSIKLSQQVNFSRLKSFANRKSSYNVKDNFYRIVSVKQVGIVDKVYCCTVPTNNSFTLSNGLLVGNCHEAALRNRQSCNLTTNNAFAFIKQNDNGDWYFDEDGWRKSLYLSTRIGSRITTLPQWHPAWDKAQKSQRLLGVSMTGLMDTVDKLNWTEQEKEDFCNRSKMYVRQIANEYHNKLNIEQSARITLVKPEGSISQLPTVSSGVHRSYAPQFIRRVRFSSVDPLAKALLDIFGEENVNPENGQGDDLYGENVDTWVFSFPIKTTAKIRAIDESAISQLERYKLIQNNYTADGHNTSITVTVAPDEWDDVVEWVDANWDCIIGVSFLPKTDPEVETYPQLPYEPCDVERYESLKSVTPSFFENQLIELVSTYEKSYEEYDILDEACSTGFCPLR